ncbi:MAG: hypothetical protein WCI73_08770 [Phycisphaerae bacterium]
MRGNLTCPQPARGCRRSRRGRPAAGRPAVAGSLGSPVRPRSAQEANSIIAAATTDLNTQGVDTGGVTLNLLAGNPETAPVGGYVIGGAGSQVLTTSSAANPVAIIGNGNTITANDSLTAGSTTDAIFKLVGADWITLSGFTMQENSANTSTTLAANTMAEWGVALLHVSTADGAQNNTIQNNTFRPVARAATERRPDHLGRQVNPGHNHEPYCPPHPHRHRAARQRAASHAGPPLAVPPGKPQHLTSPIQVPDGLAKSHWQSIRPAYEVGRHDFQPVAGGWQARNPGHHWTMQFDRCGFLSRPRAGAWTWGWSCKATASATSNSASTTNCLDANGLGTYLKKATAGTNGLFEVIDSSGSSEPLRY